MIAESKKKIWIVCQDFSSPRHGVINNLVPIVALETLDLVVRNMVTYYFHMFLDNDNIDFWDESYIRDTFHSPYHKLIGSGGLYFLNITDMGPGEANYLVYESVLMEYERLEI